MNRLPDFAVHPKLRKQSLKLFDNNSQLSETRCLCSLLWKGHGHRGGAEGGLTRWSERLRRRCARLGSCVGHNYLRPLRPLRRLAIMTISIRLGCTKQIGSSFQPPKEQKTKVQPIKEQKETLTAIRLRRIKRYREVRD